MQQPPEQRPWDPDNTVFPRLQDLPQIPNAPKHCAWVWGPEDNLGRLNLLTPRRVQAAASEIKTGETARVDLPLNVPKQPAWSREAFTLTIKVVDEGIGNDDLYHLNTQSGTQWDGFRHMSHAPTKTFYNNTKQEDISGPEANHKCSIHHWSTRGMVGRGILIDYRAYAESQGIVYDSASYYSITYANLVACGKHQGLDIRPASEGGDIHVGDFLFVRSGFVQDYYAKSDEENTFLGLRDEPVWAGLSQEDAVRNWLHDCYFAAVAGDAPAFEVWPPPRGYKLHEYLLALWGVPIGEMVDLEGVSALARKHKRWTFFFCSAPANCPGGVASHVNGTVMF
ncbi:hypothetical protein A1O1_05439 [Capronia coronata CBS 617.96]|uniref:Cyclase n=1 Tax=Capronia coronata CBS 617.96 TaxID=1182541 RepID=W9Z1X5_9EURO|nr:uncharacterized protein A1O1_05439 [Capronia coronata CBS 617.96]EXJ88509.1 hypothetical protein A1O1_05439 [Capronia coronata CBS 617.96]